MLYDIIEVKIVKEHVLFLRFENGVKGNVDIAKIIPFEGIFKKLKDPKYFALTPVSSKSSRRAAYSEVSCFPLPARGSSISHSLVACLKSTFTKTVFSFEVHDYLIAEYGGRNGVLIKCWL